jgi:hypothetical protein
MTDSIRTQIAEKLVTVLSAITDIKSVAYDNIKMLASDFQDWEIPAIQIIDLGDDNQHEQRRARKTWNFTLELVMGNKTTGIISQKDLWNLLQKIEIALFQTPNLGIAGIIHMILLGSTTDLHMLMPFYTARLDMQILYYQPLVDIC